MYVVALHMLARKRVREPREEANVCVCIICLVANLAVPEGSSINSMCLV